jgi:hypothetical protein
VEVQLDLYLKKMPIARTVSSNEKVAPNKAANNLDWGWKSMGISEY